MDSDLSSVEEEEVELNATTKREGLTLISNIADEFIVDWSTRFDERVELLEQLVIEVLNLPLDHFVDVNKLRKSGMTPEMRIRLPTDNYPLDIDSFDKFCVDPAILIRQKWLRD